jgi:hypothetical protein
VRDNISEPTGRVTERTFYPALMKFIKESGGSGVQEICFNTEPDIIFQLLDRKWLLSVKIGEDTSTLKSAFIQYQRHKDDSKLNCGLILFLPSSIRRTKPEEDSINAAIVDARTTCLVDTPIIKQEYRTITFPHILLRLISDLRVKLERREEQGYSLKLVVELLQQHVSELMETIALSEASILRVITDRKLLSNIGHLTRQQSEATTRFLAAYIILSQILFLRLFGATHPDKLPTDLRPVSHLSLRKAFEMIRDINYRPIYKTDVLDSISEQYLRDTFDLIWGLEVESIRHELPGRIFHALMPRHIRKMLASFYTRPQAADILANLTIRRSDDTVFDPASGSGTILTAAYKRKLDLFIDEGKAGNPHKRFCEDEIFGADIMPFAVHLTGANLAATDPGTTIERTQIIQGDSLKLSRGRSYPDGIQIDLFQEAPMEAEKTSGERYKIDLKQTTVILMNPPFTKVERGIHKYVDMQRFSEIVGGEVGLWGHFIGLANDFLNDSGMFGAVIPINILRGRESAKVREIIFSHWTPLYILKPTLNYGFSEWAEYRDILLIASKRPTQSNKMVKFCLVKQDLTRLNKEDTHHIAQKTIGVRHLRSDNLDIEPFSINELRQRFENMMWFCGVSDFQHRDILISFLAKFTDCLHRFPDRYFREGYRPVPKGVSSFLFLTRELEPSRKEEAFLTFDEDSDDTIRARSHLGVQYEIERDILIPTLRTGMGIRTLNIQNKWDYIASSPYRVFTNVTRATGFRQPRQFNWDVFWERLRRELQRVETRLVILHRINPYSPNTYLTAFVSEDAISPSNMLNVIKEPDLTRAKAVAVLLNSSIFLAQFFLLKEESTARYINIRFYDLYEMIMYPDDSAIPGLARVFDHYSQTEFPSLREQLDIHFDQRYKEFWSKRRSGQLSLFSLLRQPIEPTPMRIEFDKDICKALGVEINEQELTQVYSAIVNEMIVTRGLRRD